MPVDQKNSRNTAQGLLAADYFTLNDAVALVTGASSGLGRHFAKLLADAGCVVALAARREDKLRTLSDSIHAAGGRAIVVPMDVTDRQSILTGVQSVADQVGPITILVNNAGIADSHHFIDAADSDTDAVFAINQSAVWQVAQIVCKQLIAEKKPGSVINIASIAGLRTLAGAASYAVSKAAVVQMTKVMALELARYNIRVNALAPGYIVTEMNAEFLSSSTGQKLVNRAPMRRTGECQELDAALLLLASDRGSFMTGAILPIDGGHLVSSL